MCRWRDRGSKERGRRVPRLIAVIRVGAVVVVAMVALAGCASGVPSSSPPSAHSSPQVQTATISVGSPAPSDSASRTRAQDVTQIATGLLSGIGIPPGAVDHDGAPVGTLSGPAQQPMSNNLIDVANSWVAPGTVRADLAYMQQHLPPGLRLDGSGGGTPESLDVFYRAAAGADDEGAEVLLAASADPAGGVDLRVDVQDVWQPIRPASDVAPETVRGATLISRTGLTTTPPPPTTTTVHVDAAAANRIAALLNTLPTQAGGAAPAAGPPNATISITFDSDPSGLTYVAAGSFYNTVTIHAPDQQPLTLSNAATLVNYLTTFFSATAGAAPASSPPPTRN
jgi:hypothetical protein